MSADDDADCVEHVWGLAQLHLSVERGAEQVVRCTRCPAVAYVPDTGRASRERLKRVRAERRNRASGREDR